jgi:hypothetical protein
MIRSIELVYYLLPDSLFVFCLFSELFGTQYSYSREPCTSTGVLQYYGTGKSYYSTCSMHSNRIETLLLTFEGCDDDSIIINRISERIVVVELLPVVVECFEL